MSEDILKDKDSEKTIDENLGQSYIDFSGAEKILDSIGFSSFEEVSKEGLINLIYKFIEHSKKVNYELNELISEKNDVEAKFNEVLRKVAKWENDKNIMLSLMRQENEKIEMALVQNVVDVIDAIESFEGLAENIDKLIKPTVDNIINKFGLKLIDTDAFDPQKHIAVDKISEGVEVYKCIKKGYTYKNKIIRFASVILN